MTEQLSYLRVAVVGVSIIHFSALSCDIDKDSQLETIWNLTWLNEQHLSRVMILEKLYWKMTTTKQAHSLLQAHLYNTSWLLVYTIYISRAHKYERAFEVFV